MKTSNAVLTGLAVAIIVAGLAWAIDVDVSGETKLPKIDVDMTGGELPEVDVRTMDVDVREGRSTVTVPDVDVDMEETTIPYPEVDVTSPEENQAADENDMDGMDNNVDTGDGETEIEDNNLTY